MAGSSIDNDEDDVASFSKKFRDKGLTFLSHCGNRKDVPNSGGSINGREQKKNKLPLSFKCCVIMQQEWSGECSFFDVFFLFFIDKRKRGCFGWGGECFWSKIEEVGGNRWGNEIRTAFD